jgi:hypothetical protein
MNTLDVLRYGQRTIRSTVDRYGPGDWGRIALGVWTAKDLSSGRVESWRGGVEQR